MYNDAIIITTNLSCLLLSYVIFVLQNFNVDAEKVILTCVYPRKELELDLDGTSLDQHGLVPSGVVMARTKGVSNNTCHACIIKLMCITIRVKFIIPYKKNQTLVKVITSTQ